MGRTRREDSMSSKNAPNVESRRKSRRRSSSSVENSPRRKSRGERQKRHKKRERSPSTENKSLKKLTDHLDDEIRKPRKSILYYRKKKYSRKVCVLLFLPKICQEDAIKECISKYRYEFEKVNLYFNSDGVTQHAFVEFFSQIESDGFLRSCEGNVIFLNCNIKVISEESFFSAVYIGESLYDSPVLPNFMQNDNLARSLIENPPCRVLIFKSLEYSVTEDQVREAMSQVTQDPIFDIRVIKDKETGLSRGFCFVEMGSIADATKLLNLLLRTRPYYVVGSRRVLVGYARMNTYANNGINYTLPVVDGVPISTDDRSQVNMRIASDAIAAAKNLVGAHQRDPPDHTMLQSQNNAGAFSRMSFDAKTGLYFDSNTNLYFDPNSGFYYDPTSGKYMHYNMHTQTWNIVEKNTKETMANEFKSVKSDAINDFEVSNDPKEIAKNMEKWAKKQNSDIRRQKAKTDKSKQSKVTSAFRLVDSEIEKKLIEDSNNIFINYEHLVCLLCVRKFKSNKVIKKHIQSSELHRNNYALFLANMARIV